MPRFQPLPDDVKARIIERFRSKNPPTIKQVVRETKLSDSVVYRLRKEALLDHAPPSSQPMSRPERQTEAVLVKRIRELEAEIARKNALIADLSATVVALTKKPGT